MTEPKAKSVYHYKAHGVEISEKAFNKLLLAGKLEGVTCEVEKVKDDNGLSEGAKTYLRELWIERNYNRKRDFTNKYVEKGLLNEETSIDYASLLHNELYEKNINLFANDYITGTPDILTETHVIDVKSSYDIFTYSAAELTKVYFYQLQSYMELTGLRKAKLIYCLTDAPEATIQREIKSALWQLQDDTLASELEAKLRRELCYQDIPLEKKVKVFEVEYQPEEITALYGKIEKAREYFNTLSL